MGWLLLVGGGESVSWRGCLLTHQMLLEFLLLRILTFTVTVTPFVQQTRITIIY